MSECPRSELRMQTPTARLRFPVILDDECGIVDAESTSVDSRHNSDAIDRNEVLAMPAVGAPGLKRALPPDPAPNGKTARIAIHSKGRIRLLEPVDLVSVHAQGNYVLLQLQTGSHLFRGSISTMAEKLEPYGFIRIHRSVLINSTHVEGVRSLPTGEYGLRLRPGKTYTVGRRYARNLRFLAELWLGAEPGSGRA
jgi:DNA-binding LytR/AlgR family response regulator